MTTNTKPISPESGSDELERLAQEEIAKRRRFGGSVSALVLPAGEGQLAFRLAKMGCAVTGADSADQERRFTGLALANGFRDEIRFAAFDYDTIPEDIPGGPFDLIICRRGLCRLPYGSARTAVRRLLLELKIGGKLYVSVLGLHSELGDNYPAIEEGIEHRFAVLADAMAEKYAMHYPVCLYTERNLFSLMLECGASVLRTFTTTHGNVKAVAVRV